MVLLKFITIPFLMFFSLEVKSNENDLRYFFENVLGCIEEIQREPADFFHQRLHEDLCDHFHVLSGLLTIPSFVQDSRNRQVVGMLESLYRCLQFLLSVYETRQRSRSENRDVLLPPPVMTRHQGRPQYSISGEQISHLVSLGMNWQNMATCLGISRRTLYRHRQLLGIQPLPYSTISNDNLNRVVGEILQSTTNAGERYVHGSLRSRGLRLQRWRVRQSLQEVDPIGRSFRRRHAIRRRIYHVSTSNQLW